MLSFLIFFTNLRALAHAQRVVTAIKVFAINITIAVVVFAVTAGSQDKLKTILIGWVTTIASCLNLLRQTLLANSTNRYALVKSA